MGDEINGGSSNCIQMLEGDLDRSRIIVVQFWHSGVASFSFIIIFLCLHF
ncbi:hypothetical protein AAZX31_14G098200 [Glycine max]